MGGGRWKEWEGVGCAEYCAVTDAEALEDFQRLSQVGGGLCCGKCGRWPLLVTPKRGRRSSGWLLP